MATCRRVGRKTHCPALPRWCVCEFHWAAPLFDSYCGRPPAGRATKLPRTIDSGVPWVVPAAATVPASFVYGVITIIRS